MYRFVDKFLPAAICERKVYPVLCGWYRGRPGDGRVKLHLPDGHADFIFSVAAEEYGLLACLFLIGLFGFVVIRGYAQSLIARDMFSMLAVSGRTQFGVQAAIQASSLSLIPPKA